MNQPKTLLTADEFFRLYSHKEGRYELVDGEVVEMAPVNEQHGDIAFNISGAFFVYARERGIGRGGVETGYRVRQHPDIVRSPDVSFNLRSSHAGETLSTGFVTGAPDIAVEIISPSNSAAEIARKVSEYLAAGSQRVWVAYPSSRSVVVHLADGTTISYTGDGVIADEVLLPGFSLPLADIFR